MPDPEKDKRRETGLLVRVARSTTEKVLTLSVTILVVTFLLFVGSSLGFTVKVVEGIPVLVQISPVPVVTEIISTVIPVASPTREQIVATAVTEEFIAVVTPFVESQTANECPYYEGQFWLTHDDFDYDEVYGSTHWFYYATADNAVAIGVGYDTHEETIYLSDLPMYEWVPVHFFSNVGIGMFYICKEEGYNIKGGIAEQ